MGQCVVFDNPKSVDVTLRMFRRRFGQDLSEPLQDVRYSQSKLFIVRMHTKHIYEKSKSHVS